MSRNLTVDLGPYYIVCGRDICRDGTHLFSIVPVALPNGRYTAGSPADVDDMAAHVCALLNKALS